MGEVTLIFGVIIIVAFTVEAALGFGATVVAVSLGAFLLPLEQLLPAFVPLNLAMSLVLVARYWRLIDGRFLLTRILPFMALGLPLGFLALASVDEGTARTGLGAFVVWLAALELWRARSSVRPAPLPEWKRALALLFGGVVHGAFATGGPLVVYVVGRTLSDKGAFRATLSALWLVLNLVLLVGFSARGVLDEESGARTLTWLPFLAVGLVVGELLHRRVPAEWFKRLVFTLLLIAGALLVLRS